MSVPPEADLRRLYDRAPVGFYRSTVDGRFLYVNPALVKMLGYERAEDVLALRLADDVYATPGERGRLIEVYLQRGLVDGVTVRWRTRTGAPLVVRLYGYAVDDERSAGFEVTAVDVTALHVAEAEVGAQRALAETSEAALRMLIDQVPAIMTIIDRDLRFTTARGSGLREVGLAAGDLIGRTMLDFVDDTDPSIGHARAALAGETRHFEYEMAGRQLAGSVAPLRAGDKIVGAVSIAVDVTDARRLEARIQAAHRAESLGVLAGGVAHDFNNLLVAMLGNADLALLELPPAAEARVAVDSIRTAALRAAELTDQLLAVAGRRMTAATRVELRPVIDELLVLLRPTFRPELAVEVSFEIDARAVKADPTQLRQVLLNLIGNARDAVGASRSEPPTDSMTRGGASRSEPPTDSMTRGGASRSEPPTDSMTRGGASRSEPPTDSMTRGRARGRIGVRARAIHHDGAPHDDDILGAPAGDHVVIEVTDDGAGMEDATRRRVFEPFFTTKPHGHGLGLAAVLGIVRGHGGGIRLTSAPGRGTTFQVFWPAAAQVRSSGARILVVDDEAMVRDVVCRMLDDVGYATLAAADGPTALAHVRRGEPIDAVILDLTMPGMSGREVLGALRAEHPTLPVIVCSGDDRDRDAVGATSSLSKPFHFDELVAAIEAGLAR